MYEYSLYQWLTFFFIYCFFGWIFESAYVSFKKGHFVNRGFLRLPLLPLYGTGAVMMLWVSLPVKDNLFLMYASGVVAATILEFATGWGMEKLFKMKYWDYSGQRFNIKGYICLTSSIAWGFLTIFLTEVIHRPVERYVLGLPMTVNLVVVIVVSLVFAADTVESVKAALDLAKVLDAMTKMRAELDDIQVQMALLKAEAAQRVDEAREEAAYRLGQVKSEAALHTAVLKEEAAQRLNAVVENTVERVGGLVEDTAERVGGLVENTADRVARTAGKLAGLTEDAAARVGVALGRKDVCGQEDGGSMRDTCGQKGERVMRDSYGQNDMAGQNGGHGTDRKAIRNVHSAERHQRLAALSKRLASISEKRRSLSGPMGYYRRSLLKGNPGATSSRFAEALKELREMADGKK